MGFDEESSTKEPLNMKICRDELLKYLTGSFKVEIVVCIACFFAALAVTILVTASAISEINDIEVFDFMAFCYCVLLVFSDAVALFV